MTTGTGTFTVNNNMVSANSAVQVGVSPTPGTMFTPVLQLDDGVQFTSTDKTGTFTTTGSVSAVNGDQTMQLLDSQKHTFTAPGLLSSSFFTLAATDTNKPHLEVGGGAMTVTALRVTSSELDLQGSIDLAKLNNTTLEVQGNDFVAVNGGGVSLDGPDTLQTLPTSFSVGGLKLTTTANLQGTYIAANNEFDLSGSASIAVAGNTLSVDLGTPTAPGLVFVNGQLQTIDASITSDFKIGGVELHTEDLTFHYSSADADITITGKASLMFEGQKIELALGSTDAGGLMEPGIVIDASTGTLERLDAAVSTDIQISDVTLKADNLSIHYATNDPDLTITGTAEFDLKDDAGDNPNQMISVALGSTDANGGMHPGLEINTMTGALDELDAAITTDITLGGLEIKADGLGIMYQSDGSFVVFGGASFTFDDHTIGLTLGGNSSPGLVITNGTLTSLEASITGDINLLGITIQAQQLGINYVAANNEFDLFGGVSIQTSFATFSTTLGTEQDPGLSIVNGQLQNLNITVDGGFSLDGINISANGVMIQYAASTNELDLAGGVMVDLSSAVQISASIGGGGLLINPSTGSLSIGSQGVSFMGSATVPLRHQERRRLLQQRQWRHQPEYQRRGRPARRYRRRHLQARHRQRPADGHRPVL